MLDFVEKKTLTKGVVKDLPVCSITTPIRPEVNRTKEPTGYIPIVFTKAWNTTGSK